MKLYSALVTGANRGIGLEFVKQLVSSQDAPKYVFATYRNPDNRQELDAIREDPATKSTLHIIKLDVTKKCDIEGAKKIIEDLVGDKGLTLLINNAGYLKKQSFTDSTEESLSTHFSINTVGPIMVFQKMLPLLQKAAAASPEKGMSLYKAAVLNISSSAGSIATSGSYPKFDVALSGYKISKTALNMAMRIAAEKVREHGILVVNVCPGAVRTDMMRQPIDEGQTIEEAFLKLKETDKALEDMELQETCVSVSRVLKTVEAMNEANHGTYFDQFAAAPRERSGSGGRPPLGSRPGPVRQSPPSRTRDPRAGRTDQGQPGPGVSRQLAKVRPPLAPRYVPEKIIMLCAQVEQGRP